MRYNFSAQRLWVRFKSRYNAERMTDPVSEGRDDVTRQGRMLLTSYPQSGQVWKAAEKPQLATDIQKSKVGLICYAVFCKWQSLDRQQMEHILAFGWEWANLRLGFIIFEPVYIYQISVLLLV